MPRISLHTIVTECDKLLHTATIGDYPGAANGLQMQNAGKVTRIAAAVDASLTTIQMAAAAGADLLVVHHGLFWGPRHPWTGRNYEILRLLIANDLAVYSSHLPLDAHPKLGNNARLCAALGLKRLTPFFASHGQNIGLRAEAKLSRQELQRRLDQATGGESLLIAGGGALCRRIGVVTGGAGGELREAVAAGVDTFITGEGPHWTYAVAEELGVNVFYAGHYATETFGVKALATWLSQKHKIPWEFLDHPTGL